MNPNLDRTLPQWLKRLFSLAPAKVTKHPGSKKHIASHDKRKAARKMAAASRRRNWKR